MKKSFLILLCFPVFVIAKNDPVTTKSSKLLLKITSDTVKGSFDQIQINYDQMNRVVRICQTKNMLSKQTKATASQVSTNIIRTQDFEYEGNNQYPTMRKRAIYIYDSVKGKDVITDYQVQYFKYKDGKRVGDSILNNDSDNKLIHISEYQGSLNQVRRSHDAAHYASPPNKSTDYISFGLNVKKAAYEVHQFNNDVFGYYFTFQQFDHAINPLKTLNVAPYIASEIFDFAGSDLDPEAVPINRWDPPCMPSSYLGWSFLNENNPTSYTKKGSDGTTRHECPLINYITIAYTYNTQNLPKRCAVTIKTVNLRNPDKSHNAEGIEKRQFNFTYNN